MPFQLASGHMADWELSTNRSVRVLRASRAVGPVLSFSIDVGLFALVRLFLVCSDEKRRKIILEVGAAVSGADRWGQWGKQSPTALSVRVLIFSCPWIDGVLIFIFIFFYLESKTHTKSFDKVLSCRSVPVTYRKGLCPGGAELILCIWAWKIQWVVDIRSTDFLVL